MEHAVQRHVLDWISRQRLRGPRRKREIAFVTGSTDSRRSAVACSIAEACKKVGSLAATFIPPAESEAYSAKQYMVATLAYQMSLLDGFENFSGYVVEAIDRDIHIFTRSLRDQLERALLEPLRLVSENEPPPLTRGPKPTSPIIVVIDGLERISLGMGSRGVDGWETLDVLLRAAGSSLFPFLILVTSRAPDWTYRSFVAKHGMELKEFSIGAGESPTLDQDSQSHIGFLRSRSGCERYGGERGDVRYPWHPTGSVSDCLGWALWPGGAPLERHTISGKQ